MTQENLEAEGGEKKILYMANWGERFAAWLVDLIVIGGLSIAIWSFLRQYLPFDLPNGGVRPPTPWRDWPGRPYSPPYSIIFLLTPFWLLSPWSIAGGSGIILFLYWAVTEGIWGQSLGKRLLGLKVVSLEGNKASFLASIIESLGKAFLLPIDIIVGLVIPEGRDRRQRLFNYLSNTIVIRTRPKPPVTSVEYVKA